jgi:hypothetical protein
MQEANSAAVEEGAGEERARPAVVSSRWLDAELDEEGPAAALPAPRVSRVSGLGVRAEGGTTPCGALAPAGR